MQSATNLESVAGSLIGIAREIAGERPEGNSSDGSLTGSGRTPTVDYVYQAKEIYNERRLRNIVFLDDGVFGEPAWDLMLDLYIATSERRRTAIKSACIGASVPMTTALRWIVILETKGWVAKVADPMDGRRTHVSLTSVGQQLMEDYLDRKKAAALPTTKFIAKPIQMPGSYLVEAQTLIKAPPSPAGLACPTADGVSHPKHE